MNCARCTILLLLSLWLCGTAQAHRVETIDALAVEGRVTLIDAKRVVVNTADGEQTLKLADVTEIDLAGATGNGQTPAATIVTNCGGKIPAEDLTLSGKSVNFVNAIFGRRSLGLSAIKAIYFPSADASVARIRARCDKLLDSDASSDVLIMTKSQRSWIPINGALEEINANEIVFSWKGALRNIARGNVRAIFPAGVDTTPAKPSGYITGRAGSRIALASVELKDDELTAETVNFGSVSIAVEQAQGICFISDRLVDLSDLTPADVFQYGFLDKTYTYKRNRSVAAGSLQLDGRKYSKGLGLHSYCRLTYRLSGEYVKFVAVVGIDDAVRPAGDVTVKFIIDGEVIADYRLLGKQKSKKVCLDISGAEVFEIEVGFGPDGLDVADHVDLADARLIRRAEE